jgi:murein DD-endopeptidase MepM/ murein hydrolase activator NlpD
VARLSPWLLIPAVAIVAWAVGRSLGARMTTHPFPKPANRGAPFAQGGAPIWPIAASSTNRRKYEVPYKDVNGSWHGNMARAFKASRDSRYHVGLDLYANANDIVLAPEDGVVVGRQPFLNGTGAMLIQLDSGIVVLLGETKMGGAEEIAREFNHPVASVGTRVRQGQPVTKVGLTENGSHMLHLETYIAGTTKNHPWYRNKPIPPQILDPTDWMLKAKTTVTPGVA